MTQENEFDRLERFVNKLLTQYEQVLDKNAQLQRLVKQQQDEIDALRSRVDSADSERGDISDRIQKLIEQIEEWQSLVEEEQETGFADGEDADDSQEQNFAEQQTSVGEDGAGKTEAGGEEKESSQQRNLFQVGTTERDTSNG